MIAVPEKTEIFLNIPPQMWHGIRDSIQSARKNGEEAIAFIFCERKEVSSSGLGRK